VKAKSISGVDHVISKLDVPFTYLKETTNVEGWFPLQPSSSSIVLTKIAGSIKLRLQWVQGEMDYASYVIQQCGK
jgi:hypothetical protein